MDNKKIMGRIFKITWPAFLELFLSSLFNVVDMAMVGRLSPSAIAGVGLTNQPFMLLISIFAAVNIGTTALVSWSVGAGDQKKGSFVVKQTVIFNLFLGAIMSIIGFFGSEPLMKVMSEDPETIYYSTIYLQVLSVGVLSQSITMGISAALRGCGRTRIPMIYNVGANFINVGLNFVLIYGKLGFPEWGVFGAGVATTTSRILASVAALCVVIFYKGSPIRLYIKETWKPHMETIKGILSIGIPAAGEQLVIQSGLMIFSRVVSTLGVNAYAAHQIVASINGMAFSISQAFSVSNTALVGQAVGADDYDLAERYTRLNRWLARIATAIVGILLLIMSRPILLLYTDVEEVIKIATPLFFFIAAIQFFQSTQMCTAGALRGSGDTMYPLYATIAGIWGFRVVTCLLFILVFKWGVIGAWMSFFLDQIARSSIVYARFKTGKWRAMKAKKLAKQNAQKEQIA